MTVDQISIDSHVPYTVLSHSPDGSSCLSIVNIHPLLCTFLSHRYIGITLITIQVIS